MQNNTGKRMHLLLIAPIGCGKSTILRTITGSGEFKCGHGNFGGLTTTHNEYHDDSTNISYHDIPGFCDILDPDNEEVAIKSCNDLFDTWEKENCIAKLVFILQIMDGRPQADSFKVMFGFLKAFGDRIKNKYIIIANRVPEKLTKGNDKGIGVLKKKLVHIIKKLNYPITDSISYIEEDKDLYEKVHSGEENVPLSADKLNHAVNTINDSKHDSTTKFKKPERPVTAELIRDSEGDAQQASNETKCFPSSCQFWILDKENVVPVQAWELKHGNRVLVKNSKNPSTCSFEPIIAFGHADSESEGEYLELKLDNGMFLEISEDHMIMKVSEKTNTEQAIPAGDLKVGDSLYALDRMTEDFQLKQQKLIAIRKVIRQGLYAPITASGNIVANGVLASCYCTADIKVLGLEMKVNQEIAHFGFLPLRLGMYFGINACKIAPRSNQDKYGRDVYVNFLMKLFMSPRGQKPLQH